MALTEKLSAIGNAIRAKTGKEELLTLDQMPTEIEGIQSGGGGEEVFKIPLNGALYTAHMDTSEATYGWTSGLYQNCGELVTFRSDAPPQNEYQLTSTFKGCTKLETVVLTQCTAPKGGNTNTFVGCTALRDVTFGGIGYPVTSLIEMKSGQHNFFVGNLTIFVDAETLADISTNITASGFCGFINATIIYRNSTTGEVITE